MAVAVDVLAVGLAEDRDELAPVGAPDDLAAAVRRAAQRQLARRDDAPVEPLVVVVPLSLWFQSPLARPSELPAALTVLPLWPLG